MASSKGRFMVRSFSLQKGSLVSFPLDDERWLGGAPCRTLRLEISSTFLLLVLRRRGFFHRQACTPVGPGFQFFDCEMEHIRHHIVDEQYRPENVRIEFVRWHGTGETIGIISDGELQEYTEVHRTSSHLRLPGTHTLFRNLSTRRRGTLVS